MAGFMDWQIFWTAGGVIVSLGSLMVAFFMRLGRQITALTVRVDNLDHNVSNMSRKVDNIDQRLSKLEGSFEERGRWESRNKRD